MNSRLVEMLACIPSMHKTRMGIKQHIETRLSTNVITYYNVYLQVESAYSRWA